MQSYTRQRSLSQLSGIFTIFLSNVFAFLLVFKLVTQHYILVTSNVLIQCLLLAVKRILLSLGKEETILY